MLNKIELFLENYNQILKDNGFEMINRLALSESIYNIDFIKNYRIITFKFFNENPCRIEIHSRKVDGCWAGNEQDEEILDIYKLFDYQMPSIIKLNSILESGFNEYPIFNSDSMSDIGYIKNLNDYLMSISPLFNYRPKRHFSKLFTRSYFSNNIHVNLYLNKYGKIYTILKLFSIGFINLNFTIENNYICSNNEIKLENLSSHIREIITDILKDELKYSMDFDIIGASKYDIEKTLELYSMLKI